MNAPFLTPEESTRLRPPYIFLDTAKKDKENKKSFLFSDAVDILRFRGRDCPDSFFRTMESYLDKGFWLCGYFCYEFGYCLEDRLPPLKKGDTGLLAWFMVTAPPREVKFENNFYKKGGEKFAVSNLRANTGKEEYKNQIKKIKNFLKAGLSYQVNYTFKMKFDFKGSPLQLYTRLRRRQPTSYSAFIDAGAGRSFLSFSPELFMRINQGRIITRPMKGTSARGRTSRDDARRRKQLSSSIKARAENVMITDLLRNDLGRIGKEVETPALFRIEKHNTLFQMTSTVAAKINKKKKLKQIFASLFPCGSVTGAPKIKTMQIINSLEKEPRGIYTGSIGYISPGRDSCFNVAIRTACIDKNRGELGIGGGILYDSKKEAEYKEALLKANFFLKSGLALGLLETILWSPGEGFWLLDLHLSRLKKSCRYFCLPFGEKEAVEELKNKVKKRRRKTMLRLLVDSQGKVSVSAKPAGKVKCPVKVKVSREKTDPGSIFLYHKTTRRSFYDQKRQEANREGFFETIFFNKQGQLTEGTITNIFIKKGQRLITPPVSCGLLPGVLRQYLLQEGKARERIIFLPALKEAEKVYIGNSLRGLLEAEIYYK